MKTDLQIRCMTLGLAQRTLAELTGRREEAVCNALRGRASPKPYLAALAAWEIMTPDQRGRWREMVRDTA